MCGLRDILLARAFCLSSLLITSGTSFAAISVTTQHNDLNRTGSNPYETILNTSNVNVSSFGKLFSRSVDGQIYAQPLYVPNVTIPGQGGHNVVYVCTEHNSVYAFDADIPAVSAPLWHVNLGPSLPASVIGSFKDLVGEIGITSTPVIDPASNTLYVVAETYENSVVFFRLHALDITSGSEKFGGPVAIQGSVPGTGSDNVGGTVTFNPIMQWQRPGLALVGGNVYIAFGAHQDVSPYHGWVFGYSASALQRVAILNTSPDADASGVWQSGLGLTADTNGFLYLHTGNGLMDVNTGGTAYGDSVIKVNTSPSLAITDYFSPSNQAQLDAADTDLGSQGPLLIPGTTLGVGGSKDGRVFLWNRNNLTHFNATDQIVQEWQASSGVLFGGNVFYNSTLYVWGSGDYLKAFAFNGSSFNTTPVSKSTFLISNSFPNTPAMSMSSNGATAGSGIVWATYSINGSADGNAYPGILRAFDASNVSRELWNSTQNQTRDALGSWSKFNPPTIANGKVYVATFDSVLQVYGLLSADTITATGGTPQSAAVNTAFTTALQATVRDASSNPVSGVAVTFTAPASGASGKFGSSATATATTNSSGVATAPTVTANGTAGSYVVTASASGASPATFSLTNTAGAAASITATGGTPQSATVSTAFTTALQATVRDASSNPVSGVVVTFTAPASGASGKFGTSATATAATNGSGVAAAPTFTANGTAGSYSVTATVSGASAPATFSLTNNASGGTTGGSLRGSGDSLATGANLTTEGSLDWEHWDAVGTMNRKAGVSAQLSAYTLVGSNSLGSYTNDPRPLSWTDGTPTASSTGNTHGLWSAGAGQGFTFTAPAGTTTRTLTVHVGGYQGNGTLTAHLSDGSAADFVDTTTVAAGQFDRNYRLTYNAASAGQTLKVTWVMVSGSGGNVTLNGIALQ